MLECSSSSAVLSTLDVVVIVLYFVLVLAVGFWSLFGHSRSTVSGYFLAGRFMWWLPVGASLFATNIGSEHFIGLAGSGAAGGLGVGAFELNALIILQLLGWVFLPVYIASGVNTLPEYMSKRFGGQRIRVYLAVLSLILYVFTKMSVNIYSGAIFVQELLGWDVWWCILAILLMTAVCTISGGLAAVIYMDTFQCFLMVGGASILAVLSFNEVGGYDSMVSKFMVSKAASTSWNETCGLPSPKSMTMLRDVADPDYPWFGFLFGQTPASIWYWAADQMMVQRALASKSLSHAQGATLFAGLLKITPLFAIVMPGMIARILCPDDLACLHDCEARCGNPAGCTNLAYPKLVLGLMPSGLRGVMLAGMLAALMSDLTSIFNSSSTLFTLDIWRRVRTKASSNEMMVVGRLWVLVMVVMAVMWVPIVGRQQGGQLYIYIQSVAADLSPPIAAVYLLAILWTRTNEKGAFTGLAVGFVIGVFRMALEFGYSAPACGEVDNRPYIVQLQYMYFAMVLFFITLTVTVVVSLCTKPLPAHMLIRTTYWTRLSQAQRPDQERKQPMLSVLDGTEHEMFEIEEKPIAKPIDEQHNRDSQRSRTSVNRQHPQRTGQRAESLAKKWVFWFLGFEKETKQQHDDYEEHMAALTTLEQTRLEKIYLNLILVLILSFTVGLFVFFSTNSPITL